MALRGADLRLVRQQAGTEARAFRPEQVVIAGRTTYYTVESRFSRRTLGISQQYQFFHNVWFHPHVAAGLNFTWERQTDEPGPIYFYDNVMFNNAGTAINVRQQNDRPRGTRSGGRISVYHGPHVLPERPSGGIPRRPDETASGRIRI
jgi:hypothetical protein